MNIFRTLFLISSLPYKLDASQSDGMALDNLNPKNNNDFVKNNFFNNTINTKNEITDYPTSPAKSPKSEQTNFNLKKKIIIDNSWEDNPTISFYQYVKLKICCFKHKNKFEQNYLKKFNVYRKNFEKSLDVLTYFELQHQLKLLVKQVLDKPESPKRT